MTTWTLAHPHDYFIAGCLVGAFLALWAVAMVKITRLCLDSARKRASR